MYPVFQDSRNRTRLALIGLAVLAIGCRRPESIARYRVPKERAAEPRATAPAGESARMLGAIVPHRSQTWFLKLTGPPERVAAAADDFQAVVRSLRFEGDEPQWQLPPTWKRRAGSGMRFATLEISSEGATPLEVSVTMLGRDPAGDDAAYVLQNVNRWRGQLGVPPLAADQLAAETKSLDLADGVATLVDITGRSQGDGMSPPPFAGGPFSGASGQTPAGSSERPPPAGSAEIVYKLPEGWARAPGDAFSTLAFVVAEGDETARITVTGSGGDLLANVNRWRNQVALPPATADELEAGRRPITVDGIEGSFMILRGTRETILGVIIPAADKAWFVKLKGPNALAEREQSRFEAFVRSIQFSGAKEAGHGK